MFYKGQIPWNIGRSFIRHKKWDMLHPIESVLVEHSTYPRHCLKKRLIDTKLIAHKCACCGIGPWWQGKPMPLILDHINGVNNDNRIENLRFVCSNCDAQLTTYKNRRGKKGRVIQTALDPILKIGGTSE